MSGDLKRTQFESYFAESRRNRGASKRPTFHRLPDGTYSDDHTQRHWWTWQNAVRAAQAPAAEPLTGERILHLKDTHVGDPCPPYPLNPGDWISFARAIECAHGIGAQAPTAKEQP